LSSPTCLPPPKSKARWRVKRAALLDIYIYIYITHAPLPATQSIGCPLLFHTLANLQLARLKNAGKRPTVTFVMVTSRSRNIVYTLAGHISNIKVRLTTYFGTLAAALHHSFCDLVIRSQSSEELATCRIKAAQLVRPILFWSPNSAHVRRCLGGERISRMKGNISQCRFLRINEYLTKQFEL